MWLDCLPEIVGYGSAFRFALEAERRRPTSPPPPTPRRPTAPGGAKLEELTAEHRDRIEKLTVIRREVNEMVLDPFHTLDGTA